mmetsp:Transcript_81191/g.169608  ORF Transcript_81191/g.169608 Transcript_81191/m.169608 type:complete len:215 (+) Transcript_81191:286-930(+)
MRSVCCPEMILSHLQMFHQSPLLWCHLVDVLHDVVRTFFDWLLLLLLLLNLLHASLCRLACFLCLHFIQHLLVDIVVIVVIFVLLLLVFLLEIFALVFMHSSKFIWCSVRCRRFSFLSFLLFLLCSVVCSLLLLMFLVVLFIFVVGLGLACCGFWEGRRLPQEPVWHHGPQQMERSKLRPSFTADSQRRRFEVLIGGPKSIREVPIQLTFERLG